MMRAQIVKQTPRVISKKSKNSDDINDNIWQMTATQRKQKANPYYVRMTDDEFHNQSQRRSYVFRIDPGRSIVKGYLTVWGRKTVAYTKRITYKDPETGKRITKFEPHIKTWLDKGYWPIKTKTEVHCSSNDTFDPVVGIAVCKFKLDTEMFLKFDDKEMMPSRWADIKDILMGC